MRHNFIYILITCFLCFYVSDVTSSWVLTSTVREEFEDGPEKECEIEDENVICSTNWRNRGTNNGVLEDLDGECKYFNKTTIYKCYKDEYGV